MKIEKNIALISDVNQVYYALTNCLMIKEQTKTNVTINLILIDLNANFKKRVEDLLKKLKLDLVNLIYLEAGEMFLGESKISHITNATNVRLYLPSILNDIDNVLYLDNDTVVIGDICEVFDYLDNNKSYGRPWNLLSKWPINLKFKGYLKNKWYVNAGVLYLDLKSIRDSGIDNKMIDFFKMNYKHLKYSDQDVLNCNIDFVPMPHTWNIARNKWSKNSKDISSKSKLKIYHYLSTHKQWDDDIENLKIRKTKGMLNSSELNRLVEPQKIWKEYYHKISK